MWQNSLCSRLAVNHAVKLPMAEGCSGFYLRWSFVDAQTLAAQDDVFDQFQLVKQKRTLCKRAKRVQERIEQGNSWLACLEYRHSDVEARKYPWWLKFFFCAQYRRNLRADRRELSDIKNRILQSERVKTRLGVEKSDLNEQIKQLDARVNIATIRKFRSQNYFRKWLRKAAARQVTDKALYMRARLEVVWIRALIKGTW